MEQKETTALTEKPKLVETKEKPTLTEITELAKSLVKNKENKVTNSQIIIDKTLKDEFGLNDSEIAKFKRKLMLTVTSTLVSNIGSAFTSAKRKLLNQLKTKENSKNWPKLSEFLKDNGLIDYDAVIFQPPWFNNHDAMVTLENMKATRINGSWNSSDIVFRGDDDDVNFIEYKIGKKHVTIENTMFWKWDGIILGLNRPMGHESKSFIFCKKGESNKYVNLVSQEYGKHSLLLNNYVEIGKNNITIQSIDKKDVLLEDKTSKKLDRIRNVLNNWHKLSEEERKLGFLIWGPPGVGKTATLSTIINEFAGKLTTVSLLGGGKEQIAKAYDWLDRISGPAIVIIEDFDSIGQDRTMINQGTFISDLLEVLDGERRHGIITIATTNHPEFIDKALTRPGRLGISIKYDYPSKELKTKIIELYKKKYNISIPTNKIFEALKDEKLCGSHISEILRMTSTEIKLNKDPGEAFAQAVEEHCGEDNVHFGQTKAKKSMKF